MYDLKYSTAVQYKMTQYGTFYHSSAKGHRLKINESDFSNRNQVTAIEVFPPPEFGEGETYNSKV